MRLVDSIWYGAHPLRWLLWPASVVFRAVVAVRRGLYRLGLAPTVRLAVPVVVVGNLSVGGTGKTPCTIWLAEALRRSGYAVGIVSRGYGGRSRDWPRWVEPHSDPREVGDEPVLLARHTGCPVVVGPDRVAAARALLASAKPDVLIADDGLQHYRLGRDLEIAVVDGQRGLGNGWCLPAGPLREPPARLREVDAVLVNGPGWTRSGDMYRAQLEATGAYRLRDREHRVLEDFRGQTVRAVAGIGHPQRFFDLLAAAGLEVTPFPLPDHATVDLGALGGRGPIFMTEKDAIKYADADRYDVWYVAVELVFAAGDEARLLQLVRSRLSR